MTYPAPAGESRGEIREKGSRFLAWIGPAAGEEAAKSALDGLARRYPDATHHCWAWRLGSPPRERSSDAGEPSGTAGKPILAAIEGAALHDVGVIVVRWFGGIKLGTGGLARAYRATAAEALRHGTPLDRYVYERVRVIAPFDAISHVYRLVQPPDVVLAEQRYGEENEFVFEVRLSLLDAFVARLRELRLMVRE